MHKNKVRNPPSAKYQYNIKNNASFPKMKRSDSKNRIKVTVIGDITSKEFIYCYHLVKGLCKYRAKEYEQPVLQGLTEVQWLEAWQNLKLNYGTKAFCLVNNVAVIINGKLIGGENELRQLVESKYVYHLCFDYCKESIESLRSYVASSHRPCAYMQISINDEDAGTLLFSLYTDLVPRTCENFLQLCEATKGGYAGTPVHRIVKDCWIQCGGFALKEDPDLGCENYTVPHDRRGILCMANNGRDVECSTQFFVLLQPAPWMKNKYVAFGQLIKGEKTLSKIENVPTWYESPTQNINIYKAGVLNMECEYKPINKHTHNYLQGHVEDLIELGQYLYEKLLLKVYIEIDLKEEQKLQQTISEKEASIDHKTPPGSDASKDIDFDVETFENENYFTPDVPLPPPSDTKIEKPYYIPFTDIPYEGELNSEYDLKRFLMSNYCHVTDIELDPVKRRSEYLGRKSSIPLELVSELFDWDEESSLKSSSESLTDANIDETCIRYLRNCTSTVSFAGRIVQKIANIKKKFDIFSIKIQTDKV